MALPVRAFTALLCLPGTQRLHVTVPRWSCLLSPRGFQGVGSMPIQVFESLCNTRRVNKSVRQKRSEEHISAEPLLCEIYRDCETVINV